MKHFIKNNLPKDILKFLFIIGITITLTYNAPKEFGTIWYVFLLFFYFFSKNEPFWLVFYFVTVDGFAGFFGIYSVTIQALPGLPAIELAQFFIALSVIKAFQSKKRPYVFYQKYLVILLFYLIFLILWGQMMGFSGELNAYFRILKGTLPLLLFYSIPRLFRDSDSYKKFFSFIFIVLILAFITQVFTVVTGLSPAGAARLTEEQLVDAGEFRGFASVLSSLLGLFGAFLYLSYKKPVFNKFYLYVIIACAFGNAYLSASRGWILFFAIVIFLSFIFAYGFNPRKLLGFGMVFLAFLTLGLDNPKIKKQTEFSYNRLLSLEEFVKGDITAGGTLQRLDQRSPRVMQKWAENPIFGWGISDTYREYTDGHVGNQNLLLNSGIIGFVLLIGFLFFFCLKLFHRFTSLPKRIENKNVFLVFIFFLLGWFFLHSVGAQQFSYGGMPIKMIPQAIFFSLGALLYAKPSENLK